MKNFGHDKHIYHIDLLKEIINWQQLQKRNSPIISEQQNSPSTCLKEVKAKEKLKQWENILQKKYHPHSSIIQQFFPFIGPIRILLPEWFRLFLSSLNITTAKSYLSTKKTESSHLVTVIGNRRTKRNMPL